MTDEEMMYAAKRLLTLSSGENNGRGIVSVQDGIRYVNASVCNHAIPTY